MNEELERVVTEELDRVDFDLVELRRGGTKGRPLLDVRMDRRDGAKVTVEDCARASRAIEARLDADAVLAGMQYVLEVSSPGAQRPLKRAADWRRFVGRKANVASPVLGGRREVEIVALEGGDGEETAVVRDGEGAEHRVPLELVREARLVFNWKP